MKLLYLLPIIAFAYLSTSSLVMAKTTEDIFNDLYKEKITEVNKSRDHKDDLDLARSMIRNADAMDGNLPLKQKIMFAAYDIGIKHILRGGLEICTNAMDTLKSNDPDYELICKTKTVMAWMELYKKVPGRNNKSTVARQLLGRMLYLIDMNLEDARYEKANSLARQAAGITRAAKSSQATIVYRELTNGFRDKINAKRKVDKLANEIIANPATPAAQVKEMVITLLTELNDPSRAARYAPFAQDKALNRIARLAVKSHDRLKAEEAKELAEWYHAQSKTASKIGKIICYNQAIIAYETFIEKYGKKDTTFLKAQTEIDSLQLEILEYNNLVRMVLLGQPLPDEEEN